jgi:hypothetical protein
VFAQKTKHAQLAEGNFGQSAVNDEADFLVILSFSSLKSTKKKCLPTFRSLLIMSKAYKIGFVVNCD